MRDPGNKVAVRAGGCYNVDHRNTGFCTNRPKMMDGRADCSFFFL